MEPSRKDPHVTAALGWQARLNEAPRVEDVVAIVKDYLAQWSPVDIARLPDPCRPGRVVDGDDITLYALILVREQFNRDPAKDASLAQMAAFFCAASRRVSRILAHAEDAPTSSSEAA